MRSSRHAARPSPRTKARRGAWTIAALLAVIALALGAFSIPGALASGSDSHQDKVLEDFPRPSDQVKAQIPLLEIVDALDAFLAEHRIEGFVGARVDENEGKLFIFWHGKVPGEVHNFLKKFSDRGTIEVVQVPHSLEELERMTIETMEANPTLVDGGPNENFDGLRFDWDSEDGGGVDYEALEGDLEDDLGLGVTLDAGHQPTALNVSRQNDVSPFWGGAEINTVIDDDLVGTCSTGFAARKQETKQPVMIFANHCDLDFEDFTPLGGDWTTPEERFVGRVADDGHRNADLDTALLSGEEYESAVYVGDPLSNVGAPVVGFSRNVVGALLTSTGSQTGQVDNNRTEFVSQFFRLDVDTNGDGLADLVGPATISRNLDGVGQIKGGDSGGPQVRVVRHPDHPDRFAAHAQNIISAGDTSTTTDCPEGALDPETGCDVVAYGIDVPRILQEFRLNLP